MKQEFYGVIYIGTCSVNGKQYVGQTTAKDPLAYCRGHIDAARKGGKKLLYNAIRKHGPAAFTFEIIWWCTDKTSLDVSENSFIELFETLSPKGYNLRGGGAKGKWSEKTKIDIGTGVKLAFENPEIRERHLIALRRLHNDPKIEANRLSAAAIAQAKPEHRLKQSIAAKISQNRPEVTDKRAAAMAIANARPETKVNRRAAALAVMARSGVREQISASVKLALAIPEIKEKQRAALINRPWINNGQKNRKLKRGECLPKGWDFGRYDISKIGTGRWINNGKINRRISKDLSLPIGWIYGMLPFKTAPTREM